MTSQPTALIAEVASAVQGNPFWEQQIVRLTEQATALHLAIFVEPYLHYILEGKKTVESRFASRRFAPYGQVERGDVMLLKASGGPIVGLCCIAQVWCYTLDPASWQFIREHFTEALCAQDPTFWTNRAHASFATLMRVQHVYRLPPIEYPKRDRRGWVVLTPGASQLELAL